MPNYTFESITTVYEPTDYAPVVPPQGPSDLPDLDLGSAVVESWFDASDENTFQFDGSNAITLANDKITGNYFTLNAALGFRDGVRATASSMYIYAEEPQLAKDLPADTAITMIALSKYDQEVAVPQYLMSAWDNYSGDYFNNHKTSDVDDITLDVDGQVTQRFSTSTVTGRQEWIDVCQINAADSKVLKRLNGVTLIDAATSNDWDAGSKMNEWEIGYNYQVSSDDRITEVIVLSGALSVDGIQKIEGYLAHKHGYASILDAGHPYKNVAP